MTTQRWATCLPTRREALRIPEQLGEAAHSRSDTSLLTSDLQAHQAALAKCLALHCASDEPTPQVLRGPTGPRRVKTTSKKVKPANQDSSVS